MAAAADPDPSRAALAGLRGSLRARAAGTLRPLRGTLLSQAAAAPVVSSRDASGRPSVRSLARPREEEGGAGALEVHNPPPPPPGVPRVAGRGSRELGQGGVTALPSPALPSSSSSSSSSSLAGRAFRAASQEATKLSLAFSRPPLPSREEQEQLARGVQEAALALASAFDQLPEDQGTTLRRVVRDATVQVVEGMIQLTEAFLRTPLQSLSQEQLIFTGGVWEACDRVSSLPRDNQAAAVTAVSSCLGMVQDALEEMEQAQSEGGDPYGDVLEDEEVGFRGHRDVSWSEADRQLLIPCQGLVKAARACLKKVLGAVRARGTAGTPEQVAQLDDLAGIAGDVSPSVDELVLSTYPPVNQLALRLNAGKLGSVLKKMLETARTSHVCHASEESWVPFLTGAVDHNMGRIRSLTQGLL